MASASSFPKTENIDPMDALIGKRIRFQRGIIGITQDALARELGISFQQIQKYESGQNKISASRLYRISVILKTPIDSFFIDEELRSPVHSGLSDQPQDGFENDNLMDKSETIGLIRAYYEIGDKAKRKAAIDMLKALQS